MTDHTPVPSVVGGHTKGLIERLEAAEVGSRELDAEVGRHFGCQVVARWGDFDWRADGVGIWRSLPEFTTSLDAALSLAERLNLNGPQSLHRTGVREWMFNFEDMDSTFARTPALAVCAAILRARNAD